MTIARLLATIDATFWPFRYLGHHSAQAAAAIAGRCKAYRTKGIEWTIGGSETERQAGFRELQTLAAAGFIRIKRGRTKAVGVMLTEKGADFARPLTANYTAAESFSLLKRIEDFGPLENDIFDGVLTSENATDFQDRMLPLLERGWVRTWSDGEGRIGYFLNADRPAEAPPEINLPEYDQAAREVYLETFNAVLAERESWLSDGTVYVPLSCGAWSKAQEQTATVGR